MRALPRALPRALASASSDAPLSALRRAAALVVLAALLAGAAASAPAQPAAQPAAGPADDASPHSRADLVSEVARVAPGEPFTVALRIRMDEGWHSYWKNPGDSGEPISIDWSLPPGVEAGAFEWPFPHRIDAGPVTSYGYSDEVLLPVRITPPDSLRPGTTLELAGRAEWLVCADICLPARADVDLTLPVGPAAQAGEGAAAIAEARSRLPRAAKDWAVEAARSSGSYTLALRPRGKQAGHRPELDGAAFFPAEKSVLDHAAPQPLSRQGDTYLLALQQSPYAQSPVDTLRGVVVAPEQASWRAGESVRALRVTVPVDSTLSVAADMAGGAGSVSGAGGASGAGLSLAWALLFALGGGLLLNLMPCVFPVISVKILGFAEQAGADAGTVRRHGLLFGAGVLASMWVLAALLLGLRAAGSEIGWGFQLQSPLFVALMALLFFGIGLNLLGVFEVGTRLMSAGGRLQSAAPSGGASGAFLTGVLATVVATPCTAPFMGAALGAALTLSPTGGLLIFTALGAGMALPYVALSMAPSLLDRLPRPGPWMESIKQGFAFPMFATAIWLVWVFGRQTSNGGVALLLFALLLMGMAAWVAHRWSLRDLSRSVALAARAVVGVMLLGALGAALAGARSTAAGSGEGNAASAASNEASAWQPYSPARVDSLRSAGRPVFVDFTAAWCLTCQVNERTVLSSARVRDAFESRDVALVKADWTNRDSTIARALASHGRSGVPVYALYAGDGSAPTLLPEVLTEDIVIDALKDLPGAPAASATASR
jgi:thiol:disulfide interchange protein DsbD